MVHIKVLGKYLEMVSNSNRTMILEAANKLSADWHGMLFRGDIEILIGGESLMGLQSFCMISEIRRMNAEEIGRVHKADPTILQRFAMAAQPVTETTTFEYSGLTGQIVIDEPGDEFKYSIVAAQQNAGGN